MGTSPHDRAVPRTLPDSQSLPSIWSSTRAEPQGNPADLWSTSPPSASAVHTQLHAQQFQEPHRQKSDSLQQQQYQQQHEARLSQQQQHEARLAQQQRQQHEAMQQHFLQQQLQQQQQQQQPPASLNPFEKLLAMAQLPGGAPPPMFAANNEGHPAHKVLSVEELEARLMRGSAPPPQHPHPQHAPPSTSPPPGWPSNFSFPPSNAQAQQDVHRQSQSQMQAQHEAQMRQHEAKLMQEYQMNQMQTRQQQQELLYRYPLIAFL